MPIGTPQSVGNSGSVSTVGASTMPMITTAAISAGDLVVVAVYNNTTNGPSCTAVSDGSNTYTKVTSVKSNVGGADNSLWFCANAAAVASGATITATFSGVGGAGSAGTLAAARVTGVVAVSPLDKNATNVTTGTTVTATTAALSQSTEIAFGMASDTTGNAGTSYSGASGFTNLAIVGATGNGVMAFDYQILNSTAAVSYSPTYGGSASIAAVIGTFKAPVFFPTPHPQKRAYLRR